MEIPGPHARTDQDIAEAALHALALDVRVPASRVQLVVKNGWITLSGTVDGYYRKEAAFSDVRNLAGKTTLLHRKLRIPDGAMSVSGALLPPRVTQSMCRGDTARALEPRTVELRAGEVGAGDVGAAQVGFL